MNIFLTGSQGFIGGNLLIELKNKNFNVKTLKNYNENFREIGLKISKSDFIIHCGATTKPFSTDFNSFFLKNFLFSKNIFILAQKYKVPVIFSSTAAISGNDGYPINLYGWSKLAAEDFGYNHCDNFISLRYFNVYGPAKTKEKKNSLIYKILHDKFQGKKDFELPSATITRDYVFVDDVVRANMQVIENFKSIKGKKIYDVGTGKPIDSQTLVRKIGLEPKRKFYEQHQFQIFTKANKKNFVPNWLPKINIDRGIKIYEEYLKNDC